MLLAALSASSCHKRLPEGPPSTVVWVAGKIRTLDPKQPVAEALVTRDGKLVFVGSKQAALEAAGSDAAVEEWPNSTIVPGLVDAHAHLTSLGHAQAEVSLLAARSEAEAVALVTKAPRSAWQGGWLLGRGWDQNDWKDARFPTKASLDAALPSTPVVLTRIDGHAAWVSSRALALAGIGRDTADPAGGRIVRDEKGEPTGVLVDNAIDLVSANVPAPSKEEVQQWLKSALETCARLGLTGVHDAGMNLATLRVLRDWDLLGVLPVRLYAMADGQGAEADEFLGMGRFKGRKLELRAVKLLADGALGSRGAALEAPYADEPSQKGLLLLTPEQLEARAKGFAKAGFQVAVHAIGDRANALTLDVLEKLEAAHPGGRHRVEHAQVLQKQDVERFARSGLVASFQPTHATSDMPWAEARLGAERLAFAYAWRAVLDTGAHVAFGSDFPVEHPNPLWGLYAARTRQDRAGHPEGGWRPEQKVTGEEALRAFTLGAAWASFSEGERGSLEVGKDADFVVLPVDPVDGEAKALLDAKVQVTVVDGVDVYRALTR